MCIGLLNGGSVYGHEYQVVPMNNLSGKAEAVALFQSGQLDGARGAAETLLARDNSDAELWCLLAVIHGQERRFPEAVRCAQESIAWAPDYALALLTLGRAEYELQQHDAAIGHLRQSVRLQPQHAPGHLFCGNVYVALRRIDDAIKAYETTLAIDATNVDAQVGLTNIYERLGKFDKASACLDAALAIDARHPAACLARANQQRREGDPEAAVATLRNSLQHEISGYFSANLNNELGHILDRLERYDEAFDAFSASQKTAAERYRGRVDPATTYDIDPGQCRDPLFLVGFPRSGTTLTEQLLAAHSRFVTSDEARVLDMTIGRAANLSGIAEPYPECIPALQPEHIRQLREFYRKESDRLTGGIGDRQFVDKHPLNLAEMIFIRHVFPRAKVLFMMRDPRDVCLSCYFQLFKLNRGMVHFTDLAETVQMYAATMDLWNETRERLKFDIIDMRYEDITADPEGETRRLFDFLGEVWEPSVLKYYQAAQKRFITTPSARDVSKPIYRHSVQRWRNYGAQLAPHMETLQPYIEGFGYTID